MNQDKKHFFVSQNVEQLATRAGFFLTFFQIANAGVRFMGSIVLARLIVPEVFGRFSIGLSIASIASSLLSFELSTALLINPNAADKISNALVTLMSLVSALLIPIAFLTYPFVGQYFGDERIGVAFVILFFSFWFSNAIRLIPHNILMRKQKYLQIGATELFAAIISTAAALIVAKFDPGIEALAVRLGLLLFVPAIVLIGLSRWQPKWDFNFSILVPFVKGTLFQNGAQVFRILQANIDRVLLGTLRDLPFVGAYSRMHELYGNIYSVFIGALLAPFLATASQLKFKPRRLYMYYLRLNLVLSYTLIPIGIFLIFEGKSLVRVVLGHQWDMYAYIFQILGMYYIGLVHEELSSSLLLAIKRERSLMQWRMVVLILTVGTLVFAKSWGGPKTVLTYALIIFLLRIILVVRCLQAMKPASGFRLIANLINPIISCAAFATGVALAARYFIGVSASYEILVSLFFGVCAYSLTLFYRPIFDDWNQIVRTIGPRR